MNDKRKPRNTTQDVKDNPLVALGIAMSEGTSGMIENQEATGRSDFVNSTTLPTEINTADGKKIVESFGIVFGEMVEDDPMFQYVTLPEGWTREGTGHSMGVLDDKGRKRIDVFYKAAFYDRVAHLWVNKRYNYSHDYDRQDSDNVGVTQVMDRNEIIHETEPIPIKENDKGLMISELSNKLAVVWLDEHYPDWNNPATYWE